MVVGITLATIAVFRSSGKRGASFLDPAGFRKDVKKRVKDEPQQGRALEIVDGMTESVSAYDAKVRTSMDAYLELAREAAPPNRVIEAVLGPLEADRRATLAAHIESRERLRGEMTDEEWDKVFGKPEHDRDAE